MGLTFDCDRGLEPIGVCANDRAWRDVGGEVRRQVYYKPRGGVNGWIGSKLQVPAAGPEANTRRVAMRMRAPVSMKQRGTRRARISLLHGISALSRGRDASDEWASLPNLRILLAQEVGQLFRGKPDAARIRAKIGRAVLRNPP